MSAALFRPQPGLQADAANDLDRRMRPRPPLRARQRLYAPTRQTHLNRWFRRAAGSAAAERTGAKYAARPHWRCSDEIDGRTQIRPRSDSPIRSQGMLSPVLARSGSVQPPRAHQTIAGHRIKRLGQETQFILASDFALR